MVTIWSSGEAVGSVTVLATGEDRPVTRSTTTDADGRFRISLLPAGRYSVTAAGAGYSTVTIVGVVVLPGEERRVELKVSETDEEESVTETINDTLQLEGVDGGWVLPVADADTLPFFRGSVNDVGGLFPRSQRDHSRAGEFPVDAVEAASFVTTPASTEVAGPSEERVIAVPRSGMDGVRGSLRLLWGERVSGVDDSQSSFEQWGRGVLALGGANAGTDVTGFLAIEHLTEPVSRTALTATVALESAPGRSFFFFASGLVEEGDAEGASPASIESDFWSLRGSHAWQISSRATNAFSLRVERSAGDLVAGEDVVGWRRQSMIVEEQIAWLPATTVRQELRGGIALRLGIDDRVVRSGSEPPFDDELDQRAAWLEDEVLLDRLRLRAGVRVDWWSGAIDTTEVSPRFALAWTTHGETPTVLRASWARFHEAASPIDLLSRGFALDDPSDVRGFPAMEPVRTDRAAVGISRDVSGLAAWSIDVVSSKLSGVPWFGAGNSSVGETGEVDLLEVSLGARIDAFGRADAILSYTWSDVENDNAPDLYVLPQHRASLAVRANLPAGFVVAAIARYRKGSANGDPRPVDDPSVSNATGADEASTTVDASLSKTFDVGGSMGRIAIEAYNLTAEHYSSIDVGADRAAWMDESPFVALDRSVAINLSYRFGY